MNVLQPLDVAQVYHACPEDAFDFKSSMELEPLGLLSGHDRARAALDFGTAMRSEGYNLYVLGQPGHGKHHLVKRFLAERSRDEPLPPDLAYRYNFEEPSQPLHLQLPAGMGRLLRADLEQLTEELSAALPAVFEGDEYQNRVHELKQAMGERQRDLVEAVRREALQHDILLLSTPTGFTFAPANNDGKMMTPEAFEALAKDDRERIESTVAILQKKLTHAIRQMPRLAKQLRDQLTALNEEMLETAIEAPLAELAERYRGHDGVQAHLASLRKAMLQHVDAFIAEEPAISPAAIFSRFHINLLVDNTTCEGAPVVYVDLPTHQHLVGRIEHQVHNGTLVSDFSLLRAGALHRANGGYLVVDARSLLMQAGAWETLKRVLRAGEIRTESLEKAYGMLSTTTLEPEPVPLNLKVVLLGERQVYYLLSEHDPDFLDLFKVQADLEDTLERNTANQPLYARMIATLAREAGLRPLDRSGVAAMIEHSSRLADDQGKLTARHRALNDLLREADHWADRERSTLISRRHVDKAIEQQLWRASRIHERSHEAIARGVVGVEVEGRRVGQINGLSVLSLGDYAFGQPTRITATARPGSGQVVDIEREARLGGRIHSKGVMILARCLASRYAPDKPLSLSASLAFEQSYGGVDGDSASVAEACALISAITGVEIEQRFAVTGSIDQHGRVQAVGGVNEKIEGFFDICQARGGVKDHAVLLPATNVAHLMLRRDVRDAIAAGDFQVYAIEQLDQALALLTGMTPGERDASGAYPAETLNARVVERLEAFHQAAKRHGDKTNGKNAESDEETSDKEQDNAP